MNDSKLREHYRKIADTTLHTLAIVAKVAQQRLEQMMPPKGPEAFANINTFTDTEALHTQDQINRQNIEGLNVLIKEPAIARIVVLDEESERRVYYICRAAAVHVPDKETRLASYRAPIGRLASLPIGDVLAVSREDTEIELEVVEKARLYPVESGTLWDSRNSVLEGEDYGVVTVESLRALLEQSTSEELDFDLLDRLLAAESASTIVREGLRRSVITKMELRDQPILDKFQDEIFRLPLSTRLLILGAPGTGKTTTLIRRLGQKLDLEVLEEGERALTKDGQGSEHKRNWIMFSPTELLKQYVKEAFSREGIPAPDHCIKTWYDYRLDLARNEFGLLRAGSGSGSYVMKERTETISPEALSDLPAWYTDFDQWQRMLFWDETRDAASTLSANERTNVSEIGQRILKIVGERGSQTSFRAFQPMMDVGEEIQKQVASMRKDTDGQIRSALNFQVNRDHAFLDDMASYIDGLAQVSEDVDDQDIEDEDEIDQPTTGRAAAAEAYMQALRRQSRAAARKRNVNKSTRTGQLLEWIGERGLSEEERITVGGSLLIQAALRRVSNPIRRYISGIPSRYRRFRRYRQSEDRWYRKDGFTGTEISPLEIDLLILARLRSSNELIDSVGGPSGSTSVGDPILHRQLGLFRNQVLVDEAMDFSPIQLACMAALSLPTIRSFFGCGDFNQRVTDWGTKSREELMWALPDIDVRSISVSYRQTRPLHEFAKRIVATSDGEAIDVTLPENVNNEGVPPVLVENLVGSIEIARWLAERILEIEGFVRQLPSIAVLVNSEEEVQSITRELKAALEDHNVRVLACHDGQVVGLDSDVRVFDVQHIKGLEFEAVFFVGIDRLAVIHPAVFDKYLYVGATRAATYLGLTCEGELPPSIVGLKDMFTLDWR